MKNIFKNSLFTFVLGAVLFGGIGFVVAEEIITAQQVGYTKEDGTWISADEAIDELYGKTKLAKLIGSYTGNATIDISSYPGATADNFIIDYKSANGSTNYSSKAFSISQDPYTAFNVKSTISKSVSNNTLSITGAYVYANWTYYGNTYMDRNQPITYDVWYISI